MTNANPQIDKLPVIQGRAAWIFDEEDYDIDQIIGVKNIRIQDLDELCEIAMASYDPDFRNVVKRGDILIGGANFGFGHPHSPPMRAMRHMGIAGVIADSFAPTYYRGETAMGFPQITCPGITQAVSRWDDLKVDWAAALVRNLSTGAELPFEMPGQTECNLLIHGGHMNYLQHSMSHPTPIKE